MKLDFARFRMIAEAAKRAGVLQECASAPLPIDESDPARNPKCAQCGDPREYGKACAKCDTP